MKSLAVFLAVAVVGVSVGAQQPKKREAATNSESSRNVELRLIPGELVDGVPEAFTFIFENVSDHEMRLPAMTYCSPGQYVARIKLSLRFSPLHPPTGGGGGGCGGGGSHPPKFLDQVKGWKLLRPGESLAVTVGRKQLFAIQDAPGKYDFWAEYEPPELSEEEQVMLKKAGVDFPRAPLTSAHLELVSC